MDRKQIPTQPKLSVGCTLLMLVTLFGCAGKSPIDESGAQQYGSNLGKPAVTHTEFATLTSRADQLNLGLLYAVGGVSIKSRNWIFAHAKSTIEYNLPARQFSTLSFAMGLDDIGGADAGSVVYIVQGDRRELFRSSVVKPMAPPIPAQVNIKGVKRLVLMIDDAGDGIVNDEAYWIDLQGK